MANVFISYARADFAAAERIARELAKVGVSVWYDREIPAHRAYADVIATELEAAPAVVVLWSAASAASEWVRSEANRAREQHKLVQVRLDDSRLPMPFDQIQCADLRAWRRGRSDPGWIQVSRSIDALLGGTDAAPTVATAAPRVGSTRRTVLAGAGLAIAAAGAGTMFWMPQGSVDQPNPEAALLLQKGIDMLQNNDVFAADNPGSLRDAIALLTEATEADPHSASAWGSLALAYAALKRVSPAADRFGLDVRSRSAAASAFRLDAHEPRATGALLLLRPLYRHWLLAEAADREAMKSTPQHVPLLLFVMSEMLGSVGRSKEAAAISTQFDRRSFIIPGADEQVLVDLWSAGDLQGADEALRLAIQHWPQHPEVWESRIAYLLYSGRAPEALQLLDDQSERPAATRADQVAVMLATAKALAGQSTAGAAVAKNLDYLNGNPAAAFAVAHACAALGDTASLFAILDGYYFAEGAWAKLAPVGGDEVRRTDELFQPPMKSIWNDASFAQLVERIGLEDYWRRSGSRPDFRNR